MIRYYLSSKQIHVIWRKEDDCYNMALRLDLLQFFAKYDRHILTYITITCSSSELFFACCVTRLYQAMMYARIQYNAKPKLSLSLSYHTEQEG